MKCRMRKRQTTKTKYSTPQRFPSGDRFCVIRNCAFAALNEPPESTRCNIPLEFDLLIPVPIALVKLSSSSSPTSSAGSTPFVLFLLDPLCDIGAGSRFGFSFGGRSGAASQSVSASVVSVETWCG